MRRAWSPSTRRKPRRLRVPRRGFHCDNGQKLSVTAAIDPALSWWRIERRRSRRHSSPEGRRRWSNWARSRCRVTAIVIHPAELVASSRRAGPSAPRRQAARVDLHGGAARAARARTGNAVVDYITPEPTGRFGDSSARPQAATGRRPGISCRRVQGRLRRLTRAGLVHPDALCIRSKNSFTWWNGTPAKRARLSSSAESPT